MKIGSIQYTVYYIHAIIHPQRSDDDAIYSTAERFIYRYHCVHISSTVYMWFASRLCASRNVGIDVKSYTVSYFPIVNI